MYSSSPSGKKRGLRYRFDFATLSKGLAPAVSSFRGWELVHLSLREQITSQETASQNEEDFLHQRGCANAEVTRRVSCGLTCRQRYLNLTRAEG